MKTTVYQFFRKCYILVALVGLIPCFVAGQSLSPSVISASGTISSNANYTLLWNLGETITTTIANANNTLTQGFEQPFLPYNVGIETVWEKGKIKIYPNPATEMLFVKLTDLPSEEIQVSLTTTEGKLLRQILLNSSFSEINISDLAQGFYFLTVQTAKTSYIFKFIKP